MNVWVLNAGELSQHHVGGPAVLTADLPTPRDGNGRQPRLLPTKSQDGIAALLVPPNGCAASRNGIPMHAGAYVVQDRDRIDVDDLTFWAAISNSVQVSHYSADVHGPDVYCFITKARLRDQEEVICCPNCELIYRKAAWEMAVEADPAFRCPRCRFDPSAGDWRPVLPTADSLDSLLDLARRRMSEACRHDAGV